MTVVRCYQKCALRGEDGLCTRAQITLDTRGACLYCEPEPKLGARPKLGALGADPSKEA